MTSAKVISGANTDLHTVVWDNKHINNYKLLGKSRLCPYYQVLKKVKT